MRNIRASLSHKKFAQTWVQKQGKVANVDRPNATSQTTTLAGRCIVADRTEKKQNARTVLDCLTLLGVSCTNNAGT